MQEWKKNILGRESSKWKAPYGRKPVCLEWREGKGKGHRVRGSGGPAYTGLCSEVSWGPLEGSEWGEVIWVLTWLPCNSGQRRSHCRESGQQQDGGGLDQGGGDVRSWILDAIEQVSWEFHWSVGSYEIKGEIKDDPKSFGLGSYMDGVAVNGYRRDWEGWGYLIWAVWEMLRVDVK